MRPTENIRDYFGWLNKVNTIILDAYKCYTLTPPELILDANGNVTLAAMRAHNAALVENVVEFYLLNQFRAALPVDLRRVINLQPMQTLDLDTAVRLATIELCSKDEARGNSRIQAVQQDEEEEGVDIVTQNRQKKFFPQNQQNRGQQNCPNVRQQNNYCNNQGQQQWRSNNPDNNPNRNKMTCIFCRKQGHQQEDCKRLQKKNQCPSTLPGPKWQSILAQDQYDWKWCSNPSPPGPGFSVLSLMEPLIQAPVIIPQLIMI